MALNIFFLIILVVCSAFFSSAETALFSLSRSRFSRLKEKYPQAKRLNRIFRQPSLFLTVIVFGNMLVNIAFTSLITFLSLRLWGERGLLIAIVFSGILILLLGEIFPKTLAINSSEKLSLLFGPVLLVLARIFYPLLRGFNKVVEKVSKVFIRERAPFNEEGLKTALLLGREMGTITEAEEEMISYVLEFKDTQASEIITPRVETEGIDEEASQEEVEAVLRRSMHSKFPVFKGSLDNITGILYAKDVFLNFEKNWKTFLRQPVFIPESKKIDDLLKYFLEKREHIAVVLDEYGGTSGIVTLEDIEEEIFGEIYDEFEIPHKMIEEIDTDKWRVYGKIPIKTLNIECDLDLPEEEDTLAGFILSRLERLPHSREKIAYKNVTFVVERVTVRRILSVTIKVKR